MDMTFVFWHWWLAAVIFFILEMAIPAALFLWMGAAAMVVGAVSLGLAQFGIAMGAELEILLFSVLSILAVGGWRIYRKKNPEVEISPTLNQRGAQYIGRELTLTKAIENGYGREKVGSSYWSIKGPDLPVGTVITIVGHDGTVLVVERSS